MKKLAEIVNHVIMNRVTLTGYGLFATSLTGLVYGFANNDRAIINYSVGPLYTGYVF